MAQHILEAKDLVKHYRNRPVVNGVSLNAHSGQVIGLLGPNGAGKTTSFYMCVGLVAPDSGCIELDGRNITAEPMYVRARLGLGYLPQEASVFRKLTVAENIGAIVETIDGLSKEEQHSRTNELLDELGIFHLRESFASSLSGGERRRVEIARALVRSPSFLLLDEPFAGIDPLAIQDIQHIILALRERGIGIIITDHNVRETLRICDRAYILVDGQVLIEGQPEEIARDENAQRYYLGSSFAI